MTRLSSVDGIIPILDNTGDNRTGLRVEALAINAPHELEAGFTDWMYADDLFADDHATVPRHTWPHLGDRATDRLSRVVARKPERSQDQDGPKEPRRHEKEGAPQGRVEHTPKYEPDDTRQAAGACHRALHDALFIAAEFCDASLEGWPRKAVPDGETRGPEVGHRAWLELEADERERQKGHATGEHDAASEVLGRQ